MEEKIKAKIEIEVERLHDEMIDALVGLVRIPSVVGSEGPAQDFMLRQYEDLGLDVKTLEADKDKVQKHSAFGFLSICFGPNGSNYHSFDEYVELDSLVLTTKAVALATVEWCSGKRGK